jgi:hypothetical protein
MYTDETVLVLNNPTLLKTLWQPLDLCSIVTLTSPSKFLTGTIFLHAHLQAVYYNCVKFYLNPMNRLGGVALTSPSLHTERISEYKLNYHFYETLHGCNTLPADVHEGIWLVFKIWKGR